MPQPNNGIDKELDMTKDNLKTFVERWDGSQPVEIPKPTGELKPPSTTLKSASMSSLAKLKPPKETTTKPTKKSSSSNSSTDSKRNNNEVAKPSGFISPARIDNDSSSAPTGVAAIPKQEQPTASVNGRDNGTVKAAATQEDQKKNKTITKGDSVAQVDESGTPRNNITKNLLDQLDQIKIKPTDGKLGQTEKTTVNGVNYLRVDNNLAATSTSPSSSSNSALSSRGEFLQDIITPWPLENFSSLLVIDT